MRAPLRVLNLLAQRFRGHAIAEIGTRNGDGMQCFSKVARSALAVEMQPAYCERLRVRQANAHVAAGVSGSGSYTIVCKKFQDVDDEQMRGVEKIHWWVGGMVNAMLLQHTMALYARGVLHRDAEVLINFDMRMGSDIANWRKLQPMAHWSKEVDFDECDACSRRYPISTQDRFLTCARAIGTFLVAGFRVADLSANATAVAASTPLHDPPNHYRGPCPGANHSARPRPLLYEGL